jgi:hypothetical protein
MKTAVEWLIDELYKQGISLYTPELIEQAKEMEKEQQMKTYKVALMRGISYDEDVYHENKWRDPEKYYNETFKQEQ